MYNLNQLVYVTYPFSEGKPSQDAKKYLAKIVDIEHVHDYPITRYTKIPLDAKLVPTGRYGVEFVHDNPTIIKIPYFWEKELSTVD